MDGTESTKRFLASNPTGKVELVMDNTIVLLITR